MRILQRITILLSFGILLAGSFIFAQTTSARLTGTITDQSGAVVAGVSLTARNTRTNLTVTVESNGVGAYAFNSLPPGPYSVTSSGPSFATHVENDIVLTIGQSATLDIAMKIGDVQNTVTVNGNVDLINTTTAEIGQIINQATIRELPLNGRDPSSLVFLAAGVTNELYSQASTLTSTNSFPTESGASAGGQRQGSTWYLLDGVSNMDTFDLLALPFPNADATQEFRVVSNNFDARNGFAPSAIVSIGTASGSNSFHGGLFEFLRNNALNAANPFTNLVDPLKRNQFGGYIGGRIFKDKLFFFGNYQGTRSHYIASTNTAYTPTAAERAGDFSALPSTIVLSTPPGSAAQFMTVNGKPNQIDPAFFSKGAVAVAQSIPIGGDPINGKINFINAAQQQNFNEFTTRLDYTINDSQRLFARSFQYYYKQPPTNVPGNILTGALGSKGVYINEVLNHTWTINPTTLNTLAVAYLSFDFSTGTPILDPSGKPICLSRYINAVDPTNACFLEGFQATNGNNSVYLQAPGFTAFSSQPNDTRRRDYSLTETFTKTIGAHTIAAGGDILHRYHHEQSTFNQSPIVSFNGQYTGNVFADFLLGYANSFFQGGGESGNTSGWMIGLYGQDQYRASRKLTLTLGLRWDPNTPPAIAGGRGAAFVPGQQSTRYPNAPVGMVFPGDKGITNSLIPASYGYFEPRLGVAWQVLPKTAVRAAFGLFTTPFEDAFYNRVWDVAPFAPGYSPITSNTQYVPFDNPWTFFPGGKSPFPPFSGPNTIPPSSVAFNGPQSMPAVFSPHLKLGVTQSWNLTVEQQLSNTAALHLAYVGSESYHQATTVQRNPGAPLTGTRLDPIHFGNIIEVQDGATSSYESLQAGIDKNMSHGFQIQSNFTWSKTFDVGGSGDPTFESSVSDPYNFAHDKGLSSLNVPFVWVTNGIFEAPSLKNHNFFLKNVIGGWEFSALYTAESGVPFTINGGMGNNNSGFAVGQDRADVTGQPWNVRAGSKSQWLQHYFNPAAFTNNKPGTPGNSPKFAIQEPPVQTMDVAIVKNWEYGERAKVQFRWEMFNALNHPSYGQPDNNPEDGNFGQITGIGNVAPRVMQAGLKLTF